ncbi:MAG: nucleotidyltransferase domain-containing protein [Candidatus Marinimicrobia bacterium]|nr:nucleotidyltransferase domain-containing protein [Candidatus Neomarinimicrobiota bacterium]MCK4447187.1 nucleotidyltransferase domain-containing protein [Candidatus Neomarinimicrobiota bacterium]
MNNIAIFGSYVKREEKPGSDIDIIVEFSERKSLLELVGIERELLSEIFCLSNGLPWRMTLLRQKAPSYWLTIK